MIAHQSKYGGTIFIDPIKYLEMSDDELEKLEEEYAGIDVDPLAFKVPSAKVYREPEDIFIEEHTIGIEEEDVIKINE